MAVGVNYDRNHPNICSNPRMEASLCAERAALKACEGIDLRGATMYSARVLKSGKPSLAKPCDRCETAIRESGIKRVIFTT